MFYSSVSSVPHRNFGIERKNEITIPRKSGILSEIKVKIDSITVRLSIPIVGTVNILIVSEKPKELNP